MHAFLLAKVNHHQEFFAALRCTLLPAQHALLLLRLSAHPRMNFLLRTLPPDLTTTACIAFDALIRSSAIHILLLSHDLLPQVALDQFCLPLRRGGLGLRSMVSIAPAAFLGSMAASAPLLFHVPRPLSAPPHSASLLRRLQEAYHVLHLPSKSLQLPKSCQLPPFDRLLSSLAATPIPKLQRAISRLIDSRLLTSIITAASSADNLAIKAHFTSLSQRNTSFYPPHLSRFTMISSYSQFVCGFVSLLLLRFLLNVSAVLFSSCPTTSCFALHVLYALSSPCYHCLSLSGFITS